MHEKFFKIKIGIILCALKVFFRYVWPFNKITKLVFHFSH